MTFDDVEGREVVRHSSSHVLAEAVQRLWPGTKLASGPAIENGFTMTSTVNTPVFLKTWKKSKQK